MLMGFSCGDDYGTEEGISPLEYGTGSTKIPGVSEGQKGLVEENYPIHGVDNDLENEFRPVEHPLEPADEDHPVKCPMPDSSVIQEGRAHERRFSESFRKRSEVSAAMFDNERMVVVEFEPPVRSVRKRHHTFSNGSWGNRITPVTTMHPPPIPPAAPLPTQGFTIFQMLQQSEKFET